MERLLPAFILCLTIFYFSSLDAAEGRKPVTLCYEDQDYLPYLRADSDKPAKPNPGVLVELTQLAFEKAGLDVTYVRRPWKRCMRLVQDNVAQGMFGAIYVPEREKVGRYPKKDGQIDRAKRLLNVDYPLFSHKSDPVGWDGKNFSNKLAKIGTPLGYATVKSLQSEQGITAITSYLPDKGLELVSKQKLDAYIVEKNVGLSMLKKLNLTDQVVIQSPPFKRHDLYLLLSHGFYDENQEKAEAVWSHLADFRHTILDAMMQRYMDNQ